MALDPSNSSNLEQLALKGLMSARIMKLDLRHTDKSFRQTAKRVQRQRNECSSKCFAVGRSSTDSMKQAVRKCRSDADEWSGSR